MPPHCQRMMLVDQTWISSIWMRIICIDGQCLNHCPPTGFDSSIPDEIEVLAVEVGELSDDADGYIFKVDLSYLQHLHDAHDDNPLAPESLEICREMFSPAQQIAFPQATPQRKFTPNLRDKVRYVVHYRNWKVYLQLGLVVTRIHKVLIIIIIIIITLYLTSALQCLATI